jgi:polyhydroxyalkanoate synthesis regulator phasin
MKIQPSVLVHLGFGKYVRSDCVTSLTPIEEERGPGRRTLVHMEGQVHPIIAARAEDTIVRDLVQEPHEVTQARQQQEILRDLLVDLGNLNPTVRRINRDECSLDVDLLERRIRQVLENESK